MKIPKHLKVGGHNILVQRHTPEQNEKSGFYDMKFDSISLTTDKNVVGRESREAEIFFHEIIERINYTYELDIRHSSVCTLSEELFAIIRNNNLDFREPKEQK